MNSSFERNLTSNTRCVLCQSNSNSSHNDGTSYNTQLLAAKGSAMVVLCVATFTMGMLPTIFSKCRVFQNLFPRKDAKSFKVILSALLSFGGGVLMCTTYLHLLPEVREQIESFKKSGLLPDSDVNIAEMVMCFGFFAMYLIEECIHAYLHKRNRKKGDAHNLIDETEKAEEAVHHTLSFRKCKKDSLTKHLESENITPYVEYSRSSVENNNHIIPQDKQNSENDEIIFYVKPTLKDTPLRNIELEKYFKSVKLNNNPRENLVPISDDNYVTGSLRGLLIVLALSVHEFFEGLAVGLERRTSKVWYMTGSVAAHKLVIAFCVGIELISANVSLKLTMVYVGTFAIVSPIGIAVGMGLTSEASSELVANAFLQGIATGTLMYVVFFEILKREGHDKTGGGMVNFLAIIVGFSIMAGLVQIGD